MSVNQANDIHSACFDCLNPGKIQPATPSVMFAEVFGVLEVRTARDLVALTAPRSTPATLYRRTDARSWTS